MANRLFLLATAAVFAAFGLWGFISPGDMVSRFGIELSTGEGRTLMRASYGGILMGEAALFAFCARAAVLHKIGLQAVLLLTAPIFLTRAIGILADGGQSQMHVTYLIIEAVGMGLAAVLLWKSSRD